MINSKSQQDKLNLLASMPTGGSSKPVADIDLAYMDRVVNYQLSYFIDKLTEGETSRSTINSL